MDVYLVRHAQSFENIGMKSSAPDFKLSPKGIEQAEYLAKRFENVCFDKIYTSHLSRAIHTAAIVANRQKNSPTIIVDPDFSERGVPVDFCADREYHKTLYPNIIYTQSSIKKEYSGDIERIEVPLWKYVFSPAFNETTLVENSGETEIRTNPQKVLIVAHASINACILSRLVNFRFDVNMNVFQDNTCVNHFRLFLHNGAQRTQFFSYNDASHLPDHLRRTY